MTVDTVISSTALSAVSSTIFVVMVVFWPATPASCSILALAPTLKADQDLYCGLSIVFFFGGAAGLSSARAVPAAGARSSSARARRGRFMRVSEGGRGK